MMLTSQDLILTALAAGLAALLSQALPSLSGRVAATRRASRVVWLLAGSLLLGYGVWSMLLASAMVTAGAEVAPFHLSHGLLSASIATAAAAFVLSLAVSPAAAWVRLLTGSLLSGTAFAVTFLALRSAVGMPVARAADPRLALGHIGAWILAVAVASAIAVRRSRADAGRGGGWRAAAAAAFLGALGTSYFVGLSAAAEASSGAPIGGAALRVNWETALIASLGALTALSLALLAARVDRRVRRRRSEMEALRRSEDRFRSLVQASAQIVWTTAPDGQMQGEQLSWAEFTGQDATAYRGWGWFNAIHPEDREKTARLWEETLASRKSAELEHRVHRHDGQYRECLARIVPVLERDGSVREWVGTHTDVTDRARMQEERGLLAEAGRALSSSLDYRETLGAVMRLVVPRVADWCAIDVRARDGSLQRLIAAHTDPHRIELLREQQAYPLQEEGDHGVARVMRTGESELIRKVSDAVLRELSPTPEHLRRLEEVGLASVVCVPLTARGQVLGVLTLALAQPGEPYDLRDLALAEELARRSATAIDNARLYSEAQEAVQARDEVLGIVSHDLRNPVSTIAMSAELLLDPELDLPPDQQRRHVEIIRRCATGMSRLIRDLLDVSQSDRGHLAVDLQPTEPRTVLVETVEQMQPLAARKGQRVTLHADEDLPPVLADRARLQQVLSNLLGNALKFVDEGGAIHVGADTVPEGVRFSVMDSGPGIPESDLPHLFDRHWRAKDTAHLGAGLGLAISRGIVEAHAGRIWVESELGRGTCFHFIIPRAPEDPASPILPLADGSHATAPVEEQPATVAP